MTDQPTEDSPVPEDRYFSMGDGVEQELKLCPNHYCMGEKFSRIYGIGVYSLEAVECEACNLRGPSGTDELHAIKLWNAIPRSTPPASDGMVEEKINRIVEIAFEQQGDEVAKSVLIDQIRNLVFVSRGRVNPSAIVEAAADILDELANDARYARATGIVKALEFAATKIRAMPLLDPYLHDMQISPDQTPDNANCSEAKGEYKIPELVQRDARFAFSTACNDLMSGDSGPVIHTEGHLHDLRSATDSLNALQSNQAASLEVIKGLVDATGKALEWWPENSETASLAGKNMGDGFADEISALRKALSTATAHIEAMEGGE